MDNIIKVIIYIICFGISIYGLSSINIEKFIKANKIPQTYTLYFMIAIALAYLVSEFILNLKF